MHTPSKSAQARQQTLVDPVPAETVRRWLQRARDTGNYFNFFRDFLLIGVGKPGALLLQDLINIDSMTRTTHDGEWFLCTVAFVDKYWSRKEQETYFGKLRKAGLIETRKLGSPPLRWVKILYPEIERALDRIQSPPQRGERSPPQRAEKKSSEELLKRRRNTVPQLVGNPRTADRSSTDDRDRPDATRDKRMLLPPTGNPATKKRTPPSPFDVACAEGLRSAIVLSTARKQAWSRNAWSQEFSRLRDSIPADPEGRITAVLDWYTNLLRLNKCIANKRIPEAYCAKSFRDKFDRIEAAMKKDQASHPEVVITPEAQTIADRLCMKAWPKGSEGDVPMVVQVSLNNLREFQTKLQNWTKAHWRHANPLVNFSKAYVLPEIADVGHFVEDWMKWVHGRIKGWDAWEGPLIRHVFHPDQKRFDALGAGWADAYAGNAKLWTQLREMLECK